MMGIAGLCSGLGKRLIKHRQLDVYIKMNVFAVVNDMIK